MILSGFETVLSDFVTVLFMYEQIIRRHVFCSRQPGRESGIMAVCCTVNAPGVFSGCQAL